MAAKKPRSKGPLSIHQRKPGGSFEISFQPGDVEQLASALARRGRAVNGYSVEAVLQHLSERGEPAWGPELAFDSEADTFVVACARKPPLVFLRRRLEKRIASQRAMRLLVKRTPDRMFEDVSGR